MSVSMFFFERSKWDDLYAKNCSLKNTTEWYALGTPSVPLGLLYFTIGVVCELVYIPFMIAMLRPEFIKYSCYKFMFLIGCIDVFVVPCNAIITGIQCLLGIHFCMAPAFFFFVGAIGSYGFYGVTLTCVILAIDRFLEMCYPKMAEMFFSGRRVYFWLPIPVLYMIYTFSHVPFVYNSKRFTYFTDPYTEVPQMQGNKGFKELTFHCIHNISVAIIVGGFYLTLLIVIKIKSKLYSHVHITKMQKLMTLQSCCICIEMWIACIVYVYNQFLPLPNFIEIIAQVSWIGVHGDTPIVYLLLNASLRKAVFSMVTDNTKKVAMSMFFTSPNSRLARTGAIETFPEVPQTLTT